MRKTLLHAAAALALTPSLAAQAEPPPFDVSRLRAAFADDGLPRLLAEVRTAKGRRAARALARLGVTAHEVLFGTLRGSDAALPGHFTEAFADPDLSATWAVPLLVDCLRSQSPNSEMAVELLGRFERAPAGTLAVLQGLAARGSVRQEARDALATLIGRWRPEDLSADVPPLDRAVCPAEWTAPLLEQLVKGRPDVTWPALQALLSIGDDAAFEAALVLVQQLEVRSRAARARRLLDVVHATYRARYGPDPSGPFQAPREVREAAVRGFVLADHHPQAVFRWEGDLRTGSATRRRTLALAAALRSPLGSRDPFVQFVLERPDEIPPLDVRPQPAPAPTVAARPPGLDRRLDSRQVIALLDDLDSRTPQERMIARNRILGAEIEKLSARAVKAVLAVRKRHHLDDFVRRHLHKAGPVAVSPLLDAIASSTDPDDRGTLLAVLARIRPMEAATLRHLMAAMDADRNAESRIRGGLYRDRDASIPRSALALLEDPDTRGQVLRVLDLLMPESEDYATIEELRPELTELFESPYLDDGQRLQVLSLLASAPREGLDLLHAMMREGDTARRVAAIRLYAGRVGDARWVDTVIGLFDDPDPNVAAAAMSISGAADSDRDRIVAALVDAWPDASPEMQARMVNAFAGLAPESGAAAPLLEPRLTAPGWGARLAAACAVLAADGTHAAAREVFGALLADSDTYTRCAALNRLQTLPEVAPAFAGPVGRALEGSERQAVLEALYVCHAVPAIARERRGRIESLARSEDPQVALWARRVLERIATAR